MTNITVKITGVSTSQLPKLSNKEIIDLFYQLPGEDIRQEIINGNLRLVLSISNKFKNSKESLDDIFQIGCMGLVKAVDNFDVHRGLNFSTYAFPMIHGEIKRHLRDNSAVKVRRHIKGLGYKVIQMREALTSVFGREATNEEIAKELEVDITEVVEALQSIQDLVSLHEPIGNGEEELFLMDQVSLGNEEVSWVNDLSIQNALTRLDNRQQYVIKKRFFEDKTQYEISKEIGLSQAQVSRLEKLALAKMQEMIL